ncbi:MAG TPA: sugar phosphate isomerase/epimerase [Patescibacteria group bacterium]
MKISAWVTVSDLVKSKQTKLEKVIDIVLPVERKHMYQSQTPETTFAQLRKSGVTGVELLIPILTTDTEVTAAKQILEECKMPVFSIHQSLTSFSSIAFSEIERLCKIAHTFGAKVVVLHSGALNTKLFKENVVKKLHQLQKKYAITFGIENMPKTPFNIRKKFCWKAKPFSTVIAKNNLHITLDTTHLAQVGEDVCEFYKENKDKIVNIHLSNYKNHWKNKKLMLQSKTHLPLTEGELPLQKFFSLLKKEKYNGLITMEINSNLAGLCKSAQIIKNGLS